VVYALREQNFAFDEDTIPDRLERLRGWGNLSASTSVGNPASLDDYYKRRHRYLITRAGQEVYDMVEGILHRIDDVSDVQAGRLRDLYRALEHLIVLCQRGLASVETEQIIDAVRMVFDPHESFSTEITQFFASINQWQSRFDLEAEEITFFAEVLVGYVSEQLVEIERMARPIASSLQVLSPYLPEVVQQAVHSAAGAKLSDWNHLKRWFGAGNDGQSRLDALTRQALAAVRTLTGNLTRLSRVGAGGASRRRDFVRLATYINDAESADQVQRLMAASFGLFPARHLGMLANDADDPVATTTPWQQAPRANVPVSLRERGMRTQSGGVSSVRSRAAAREQLRMARQRERDAETLTAEELLAAVDGGGQLTEIAVSPRALRRLQTLMATSSARRKPGHTMRDARDRNLHIQLQRVTGQQVHIRSSDGVLTLIDATMFLYPVDKQHGAGTDPQPDSQSGSNG